MNSPHLLRYFISAFLIGLSFQCLAEKTNEKALYKFEETYQQLLATSYREITSSHSELKKPKDNFKYFIDAVISADKSNDRTRAISLIAANHELITNNSNDNQLQILVRILLQQRANYLAKNIMVMAAEYGNTYTLGRIKFEFAKHHAETKNWDQALSQLNEIDITNTLEKQDGDEAFIILGAALQQKKKHREAISYYTRITPDSPHYRVAQLNTAIAYIRQDWWTDAQIAINRALKHRTAENDELSNRLYTVMGFSQVQHGFYRDARESFRHVHIKSQYAHRALLGLGVAALHQEDFIGALNAFNHLKKGSAHDISVLESYLLAAFSLEKLGQQKTAAASYTEAVIFYENQSSGYQKLLEKLYQWREGGKIATVDFTTQVDFDLSRTQPQLKEITRKRNHLDELLKYRLSATTQQAIKVLNTQINKIYIDLAIEGLTAKQAIIDNYLSQSRFGLAKLYDTN